ncbi:hypothetical protein E8E11_009871 [Didymella keratinophila]|nr:hypothetical protein E8E11_009871 [Didymella keratinophila]
MSSSSSSSGSENDDNEFYEHILEIDLDTLESARSIFAARRATTSNFHQETQPVQEQFDLAASVLQQSGEEERLPTVRFITKSPGSGTSSCKERWFHLTTESISFDNFKRHAINVAFDLHPDSVPVVMYLLNNIKDNYEQTSAYGRYIEPGTVIRCDGRERKQRDKPDISVTFVSFPYFDLGSGDIPAAPKDDTLHMARALFQQFYPKENTKDRDDDQQFRRIKLIRDGHYLRVPQLWLLILNSMTIITCGPSTLADVTAGRLEIVSEDNLVGTSQCFVHVTDFFKRVTLLTPDMCGSYLALEETIQEKCLSESGEHIGQCTLHLGESETALDPSLWPALLQDTKNVFLYIRISRKNKAAPTQDEDSLHIEGPELLKMIEYTDLGSDNESANGKELTLYRKWPYYEPVSSPRRPSRAASRSRQRLENEGFVVNTEQSLENDEPAVFPGGRPKIFRRPTLADADVAQQQASQSPSLDSGSDEGEPQIDHPVPEPRDGALADGTSKGKQVRFQYIESDAGFQSEPSSLDQGIRTERVVPVDEDINSDTVAGAEASSIESSSDASATLAHSASSYMDNQSLVRRSDPLKTIRQTAYIPFRARVDDYESSEDPDEIATDDDRSSLPSDDAYHMPGQAPGLERSGSETAGHSVVSTISEDDSQSVSSTGDYDIRFWTGQKLREPSVMYRESVPDTAELKDQGLKQGIEAEKAAPSRRGVEQAGVRFEEQQKREIQLEKDLEVFMRTRLSQFGFQENQIQAMLHPERQEQAREQETELEKLMRSRLTQFGFQENQIQVMLHPERQVQQGLTPHNPLRIAPEPTYAKIHRNYLDVETLHYYDIPYEYDADPEYIIVLREMSQKETDILFKHTRRLRSNHGQRVFIEADGRNRSGKKEYAFVRRKPYSRSQSRRSSTRPEYSVRSLSPDRRADRSYSSRSKSSNGRLSPVKTILSTTTSNAQARSIYNPESTKRERSPDFVRTRFNMDLRVPPFLAWPTTLHTLENQESSKCEDKRQLDVEKDENIKLTLLVIKARIYKTNTNDKDNARPSTLVVYKSGSSTVEITKSSCPKTLFRNLDLHPLAILKETSSQQLHTLSRELSFLQAVNNRADAKAEPDLNSTSDMRDRTTIPVDMLSSTRRVIAWQTAKLYIEHDSLLESFKELISQFVPEFFDHPLIQRCWGSVENIGKILRESCEENDKYYNVGSNQRSSDIFVVRAVPSEQYADLHGLPELSLPIGQCSFCRREKRYPDIDDAIEHVQQYHVDSSTQIERNRLTHWLLPVSSQGTERKNERLLEFVATLRRCTERLLAKAIDIRSSVADKDSEKDAGFLLPTALVKAAEKTFQFIYYSAYSMQRWQDMGLVPLAPDDAPVLFFDRTDVTGAEYVAKIADIALSNARDELMLMAHTGMSRDPVLHIRTTPETNVLFLMAFLMNRQLLPGLEVDDLYHEHLVSLRYEASRKPTKRLLREVYLWKEEMEVYESVLKQQIEAIRALREVFDSDSFRITNQVRIEAFRTLEYPLIDKFLVHATTAWKSTMKKTYKKADRLADSLRYSIAIAEEGNSKAILIFTLVTIVFLPLSFVSSVFGMNTIDVRDMNSTQTLFWAVALPVTAAVGGLSLLAAYGGPMLQRQFQSLKKIRFEVQLITFKRSRSDDEEQPRHDQSEKTVPRRQIERPGKMNMLMFTKREIALKKGRKSEAGDASTSPVEKVTLGDMFFR